jgi:signal transduction histidine kinase
MTLQPRTLRDRILAWYGGTVLIVLGLVLALVHLRVNEETGRHLEAQMNTTRRVVESLQNDRTATLALKARLAGEEPRLGLTMTTRDPATILDLLRRDLVRSLEVDFIRVTDEHSVVLADTGARIPPHTDLSHDPTIAAALRGQTSRGMLIRPGEIYLAATAPIRAGGGDLGTVTVGRRVDDALTRQLQQETGSEVTFFAGSELAATSWPPSSRSQLQQMVHVTPEAEETADARFPTRGRTMSRNFPMRIGGQRLMCLMIPLQGQQGHTGRLLIQSNLDEALRPYANIQQALAAIGLLGLLVALFGSVVVASSVTDPLRRIARAAHGLMQGDWSQRAPVSSPDEVGFLAETFNRMAERLESWDSDLRAAVADRTRELNAAVGRLDTAFQLMRRFNADASHELRTPLTVIRGEAEVALRAARSSEEYQTSLRSIQDETERMSRIIEQLLLLARADSGELRLERRSLALDDVVREVAHRAEVLAVERQIRLRTDTLEPTLLEGDEDRLHQLTLNLIDNAIKYTPVGGEVRVSLHHEAANGGPSGTAVLEIEDTGIGISASDLPHIFDRFYRVDKARSRSHGGSGLGLAICRWIVEAHNGTIGVRSSPGKGSRFTVRLPGAVTAGTDGSHPEFVELPEDGPTIHGGFLPRPDHPVGVEQYSGGNRPGRRSR